MYNPEPIGTPVVDESTIDSTSRSDVHDNQGQRGQQSVGHCFGPITSPTAVPNK